MLQIFIKKRQGFTLIEIMVVIAVIAILAGIVLVAFGPARKQAKDSRIESDMNQLQNFAENLYLEEGNYDNVDPVLSPEIAALESDIIAQQGSSPGLIIEKPSSPPPADQYCVYASLNSFNNCVDPGPASEFFCVDSWGTAKKVGTPPDVHCFPNFLCVAYFDFNGDGAITIDEIEQGLVLTPSWNCCGTGVPCDPKLDLNNDGCVNLIDFLQVKGKLCTT